MSGWWRRPRVRKADDELDRELQAHLALDAEDLRADGMSEPEAARAARRLLGSPLRIREQTHDVRRLRGLRRWMRSAEWRQVLRRLRWAPVYTSMVVAVMAIGMVLAIAAFAIVDGVLFKSLPYPDRAELYLVSAGFKPLDRDSPAGVSLADIDAWSSTLPDVPLATVMGTRVSRGFFDVIGVRPLVGGFVDGHFEASTVTPVVITDDRWRRDFDADPSVVGTLIPPDRPGQLTRQVVGIMPPGFVFPSREAVHEIAPLVASPDERSNLSRRGVRTVIARLPSGTSREEVETRLEAAMRQVALVFPPASSAIARSDEQRALAGPFDRARLAPLQQGLTTRERPIYASAFAAALLLLILACVNVAALMGVRAVDRRRDAALRQAIGASTLDVARLSFIESLILSGAAVLVAVACAPTVVQFVLHLLPESFALLASPGMNWRMLAFAVLAAVCTACATSVWPIWRLSRTAASLAAGLGSSGTTRDRTWIRPALVAVQVAVGFVLVVGGALLVRSLVGVWQTDVGIDIGQGAAAHVSWGLGPDGKAMSAEARALEAGAVLASLRAQPGVDAAALTAINIFGRSVRMGLLPPAGIAASTVNTQAVSEGFFEVLRPRLLRGRWFSADEITGAAPVMVVDESLADRWWPGLDPIGQTYRGPFGRDGKTVIGVVQDGRYIAWDRSGQDIPNVYLPMNRATGSSLTFVVRGADATAAALALRDTLQVSDSDLHIERMGTLTELLAESVNLRRLQAWVFGSFGLGALIIVTVGILGVSASIAAQRRREVGIRMALGATPRRIAVAVAGEPIWSAVAGLIAGGLVAAWAAQSLGTMLYEMSVYDDLTWAVAVGVMLLAAAVGGLTPAIAASRVDPVVVLREE